MIDTILATKSQMDQMFLADGKRIPVTKIQAGPCLVTQIKTQDKDKYQAIQLGLQSKKVTSLKKPLAGHLKNKLGKSKSAPRYLREVRISGETDLTTGDVVKANQVIKIGDLVNITGFSKGRGFTGVMKRWGFHGGPRTHGQSDRQRAPGSIGQTTTPGRVHKGKKMPGRSGGEKITVRNLLVVKIKEDGELWIKGQVPGARNGLLTIKKVGEQKKFQGLYQDKSKAQNEKDKPEDEPKDVKPQKPDDKKNKKVINIKDKEIKTK